MSKRQVENDDAPAWAVLIAGIFGGIFLSVVWCAWAAHLDRLDKMESGISDAKVQIRELQNFVIEEKRKDQVTTYTCDEMKKSLESMGKNGWSEWSFSNLVVKGACK